MTTVRGLIRLLILLPQQGLIVVLKGYRAIISPWYGQVCRYFPSCSAYALESVTVYGAVKGTILSVRRLASCHPWSPGGIDHVPPHPHRPLCGVPAAQTPRIIMLNHPERYLNHKHDRAA